MPDENLYGNFAASDIVLPDGDTLHLVPMGGSGTIRIRAADTENGTVVFNHGGTYGDSFEISTLIKFPDGDGTAAAFAAPFFGKQYTGGLDLSHDGTAMVISGSVLARGEQGVPGHNYAVESSLWVYDFNAPDSSNYDAYGNFTIPAARNAIIRFETDSRSHYGATEAIISSDKATYFVVDNGIMRVDAATLTKTAQTVLPADPNTYEELDAIIDDYVSFRAAVLSNNDETLLAWALAAQRITGTTSQSELQFRSVARAWVFNASSLTRIAEVEMSDSVLGIGGDQALAASPSDNYFAVAVSDKNKVLLLNATTGETIAEFACNGAFSVSFSVDGTRLYATGTNGLLVIDVASKTVIGTYVAARVLFAVGLAQGGGADQFGLMLDRFGGDTTAANVTNGVQIYYTIGTVAQRETRAMLEGLKNPILYSHGGTMALLAQDNNTKAWTVRYSKDWGKTWAEVRAVWDSNYVNAVADSTFLGIEVTAAIEKATKKLVYKYATGAPETGGWSAVKEIATLEKIVPLGIRARNETRNSGIVIYASPDLKWQSAGATNEFVAA